MSGKSSGSTSSAFGQMLGAIGGRLFHESDPTRKLLFQQIDEALKTGGVSAQIPEIQSAVTSANTATAGALRSAKDAFAAAGLGGDPLSQSMLAQMGMVGNEAASQIPTQIAQAFIGMAPGLTTGTTGQAISGLSGAAQTNYQTSSSSFDPMALFSGLMSMFKMAAGGFAGGAAGAAAAGPTYP